MNIEPASTLSRRYGAAAAVLVAALVLVLMSAGAFAQEPARNDAAQQPGFFAGVGEWFDRQVHGITTYIRSTRERVRNFGHEAGLAARRTVDTAKEAADVIARIPNARVVIGHEKCAVAPNGAPDCVAAANTICQGKGFGSGKSVDMTTAEVCPPKVWMAGRAGGDGCRTETFVSRALCQ